MPKIKSNATDSRVTIRFSSNEWDEIVRAADENGVPPSTYLRNLYSSFLNMNKTINENNLKQEQILMSIREISLSIFNSILSDLTPVESINKAKISNQQFLQRISQGE